MTMTFHRPDQTRDWSTRELGALIGKHISISLREDGSDPAIGLVCDAGIGQFAQAWVEFDDGSSVTWDRDCVPATVIVEEN